MQKYIYPSVRKVHAGSVCVFLIHRTLTQTTGYLTCVRVRDHYYACVYTLAGGGGIFGVLVEQKSETSLQRSECTSLQRSKCKTWSQVAGLTAGPDPPLESILAWHQDRNAIRTRCLPSHRQWRREDLSRPDLARHTLGRIRYTARRENKPRRNRILKWDHLHDSVFTQR